MKTLFLSLAALATHQFRTPLPDHITQGVSGHSFISFGESVVQNQDCEKIISALMWAYSEPFEKAGHFMDRTALCMGAGAGQSFVAYSFSTEPLLVEDASDFENLIQSANNRKLFPGLQFEYRRVESMENQRSFVVTADTSAKSKRIYETQFMSKIENFVDAYRSLSRENRIFRNEDFGVVDYYLRSNLPVEAYDDIQAIDLTRYVFTSWHQHVIKRSGDESPAKSNVATGNFRDCRDASTPCQL